MYEKITKHYDYLKNISSDVGTWHIDNEHKGTLEDPTQMPFVVYSKEIESFLDDFYASSFADIMYINTMNSNNWWEEQNMIAAIPKMNDSEVCTCITAIIRQDRFCEGLLLSMIKKGVLSQLLLRLRELDK